MSAKGQQPATTISSNWASGVQRSGGKWASGCQATNKNPFQLALAQATKAQANYSRAVAQGGSWHNAMSNLDPGMWKSACQNQTAQSAYQGSPAAYNNRAQQRFTLFTQRAQPVWNAMTQAAAGQQGTMAKFQAAITILQQAGRNGNNSLRTR
jgi:hypothetical protein